MKIRNLVIIFLVLIFSSTLLGQNQDEPKIAKGQILPAKEMQRSNSFYEKIRNSDATTIFHDDFESGIVNWTLNGSWQIGNPTSGPGNGYNSINCAATNLTGNYGNSANDWMISSTIALPNAADQILLELDEWFSLESGYDNGRIKISTNNGSTWSQIDNRSGSSGWRSSIIDLTSYKGSSVKLGFNLTSDGSIVSNGWYIDNVSIKTIEPEPLTANMQGFNSQNFPLIYMNVNVASYGTGIPSLTQSNFQVFENGILQTELFEVTPPETGGGQRLADIVFLMDNSGSMDDEQAAIRNNIISFVDQLMQSDINFALGLCRYGQSAASGNPYLEDNGQLTQNAIYFRDNVWLRNVIDGGTEPGYYAITQSASGFNFRPGAQKIFIILTDETPNQGGSTQAQAITACQNGNITLYALTNSESAALNQIATATNGQYYNITDPFNNILDDIGQAISATYIVRYSSSNPNCNGLMRNIEVVVNHDGNQASATGSYMPCQAPTIVRTPTTIALHNQPWAENTQFTIDVEVTDNYAPLVNIVKLFYKNTTTTVFQNVAMSNVGGNTWRGIIPSAAVTMPGVDYYITGSDGEVTVSDPPIEPSANPHQLAILPNVAPVINHTPVQYLTVGQPINIEAEIIDNTNSLVDRKLFYKKRGQILYQSVSMTFISGNNYIATIPTNYTVAEGVDYYISAWDNFGVRTDHGTQAIPHQIVVLYDSGFLPSKDGWGFKNNVTNMWPASWYGGTPPRFDYTKQPYPPAWPFFPIYAKSSDFPDWPIFVKAFTPESCYLNPPPGLIVYNPLKVGKWKGIKSVWGGSCYGFSQSSLLFFNDFLIVEDYFPGNSQLHSATPNTTNDSRELINKLFIYQFGSIQYANEISKFNYNPYQTLQEIINSFSSPANNAAIFVLGYKIVDGKKKIGKHSLVPFKITREADEEKWYVYVYDNNFPGEDNNRIMVYKDAGTWKWEFLYYQYWQHNTNFYPDLSISEFMNNPTKLYEYFDPNSIEIYCDPQNDVLIKDEAENAIGYLNGELNENIPECIPIIPSNPDNPLDRPIGYYLKKNNYSAFLTNFGDSTSFMILKDSVSFSYSRNNILNTSDVDFLKFGEGLNIANYQSNSNKTFTVKTAVNSISKGKNSIEFSIEDISLYSIDSINLNYVNGSSLQISNFTSNKVEKTYNLKIKASEEDYNLNFEHKEIELQGMTSHTIFIPSSKGADDIWIFVDNGFDLIIDDTLFVKNQKVVHSCTPNFILAQSQPDEYTFSISFDTLAKTDVPWNIYKSGTWFNLDKESGSNNSVISILTSANLDQSPRQDTIIVFADSKNLSDTIIIKQLGNFMCSQTIDIPLNWSAISSFIIPENPVLNEVFSEIRDKVAIMVGKSGIYWPGQNINTIGNWNSYQGYKIKMNEAASLCMNGEMPVSKTVNLTTGVNYLPVLDDQNVQATDIFNQISGQLIFAFDLGGAVYWPSGGLYTLQTLEPGKAYLVSMSAAASVTFPETVKNQHLNNNKIQVIENSPWTVENKGVGHIISIYQSALADLKTGDIIAAFNSAGFCVGLTQFVGETENLPLVVFGNDLTTSAVDGMMENEAMIFKVYNASTKEITEINPTWDLTMPNSAQFAENGLSAIISLKASTSITDPGMSNLRVFPNPNSGLFNIYGIDEEVEISVLNTTGQIIETLNADKAVEVDLSKYAKGIYYLKIVSGSSVKIEKVIIK